MAKRSSEDSPAASGSKRPKTAAPGAPDEDASDEGFIDEIERELVGDDDGAEDSDGSTDVPLSALEHVRRARRKRPRDDAVGDAPAKRSRAAAVVDPAESALCVLWFQFVCTHRDVQCKRVSPRWS